MLPHLDARGEFLQVTDSEVAQASFYKANLSSATLGAHNEYTGATFTAADLSHAAFSSDPASKPKTDSRTFCPPQGKPRPCVFNW